MLGVAASAPETTPLPVVAVPTAVPPPSAHVRIADIPAHRRELAELNQRLATLKLRYSGTRKKEADVKSALEAADLKLQIRAAERRVLELKTQEVERTVAQAALERDASARKVAELKADLGLRIGALYRMGRLGYLRTLAVAESGRDFLRGVQVLTHLARRDARLLEEYQSALATLGSLEKSLADRQREITLLYEESRKKEQETATARAEQALLLRQVQRTSEQERVAVSSLEDRSTRLASLLELLESNGRPVRAGATSIGKYKGVLDWPVRGKVVVPFGRIANPRFPKTFLRSSGWTIDVPPGTDVQAVFAGDVVFASWLKGYGNLVVLDHGEGVFTLYGRLATGSMRKGERVSLGERIGQLGESPEDDVPGLYFELRENRTSEDPMLWLR